MQIYRHGKFQICLLLLDRPTGQVYGFPRMASALTNRLQPRALGDTACLVGRTGGSKLGVSDARLFSFPRVAYASACLDPSSYHDFLPISVTRSVKVTLTPSSSGEQTATALEANLASLESKLDQLLASFEQGSTDAVLSPTTNGDERGGSDGNATTDK